MTDAKRTILIGLIAKETLIVYEANAPTTHVTIFTDSEYPPCSKLHEWVPKLTSYGVEVRYAGAPRKEPYPEMMSIWCASDRRNAMDRVKRGERVESTPCDHPLAMHNSVGGGRRTRDAGLQCHKVVGATRASESRRGEALEVMRERERVVGGRV